MHAVQRKKFGANLSVIRTERGLTQKEVADGMGYSTAQFVSNWERGVSLPPVNDLRRLAKTLRLSPRKLLALYFKYEEASVQTEYKEALRNI